MLQTFKFNHAYVKQSHFSNEFQLKIILLYRYSLKKMVKERDKASLFY